jgi:sugar phosphate isomerase/epimerase
MCIFLAAFCSACGNQNNSESTSKDSPATGASNWNMGVALYSFNLFPFAVSLQKADSSGVKYVEGFSFHKMSEEFQDTTMDNLSPYGVGRMKQLMDAKGIKMRSMYVGGAEDAQGWKRYFEMGKALGMEFLVCEPDPGPLGHLG